MKCCSSTHMISGAAWCGAMFGLSQLSVATASAQLPSGTSPVAIYPLTHAAATPPVGYFSDPYPIAIPAAPAHLPVQLFSGTTKSFLACPDQVPATCLEFGQIVLDPGEIGAEAHIARVELGVSENLNIGPDANGRLQMAATYYVKSSANARWTIIVHAHLKDDKQPLVWVADRLLVGSISKPHPANYDGKYFVDDGKLYLIYSANLGLKPMRTGLVAQLMSDAGTPAASPPVTLLVPAPGAGFASEDRIAGDSSFKLVETGNIVKIDGKYALAYSTGAYDEPDYKAAVAWSDTFLPTAESTYRKVLLPDPGNVWGSPDGVEVRYLLQSQKPDWPNDVAALVKAPGVPSILEAPDGAWRLVVAGYASADAPLKNDGSEYNGAYRRPYVVPLRVAIPPGETVSNATDAQLAGWVVPEPNVARLSGQ